MQKVRGIVYVTADEMREIDRATIETCGIDVLSLMENAGTAVALQARGLLGSRVKGKRVGCLVGKGNNGGDGLVAARHLCNWGARVSVALSNPREELGEVATRQLKPVELMGVPVLNAHADLGVFDLLVDALLGYNSKGPPKEPLATLIRRANESRIPSLAVDIPSGLDPTTGIPNDPCILAKATVTLGLPKTGFLSQEAKRYVGELYLGDVSIPRNVYAQYGQETPLFTEGRVVRLSQS